jgi:hypothetical protein
MNRINNKQVELINKYLNCEKINDDDESLVDAYIKEYKEKGIQAARLAVHNRILLVNRIKKFKEKCLTEELM